MLRAEGLRLAHPGGPVCVERLDLTLAPGTWTVLTGPNGGGKSCLCLALAGLLPPRAGTVRLGEAPLAEAAPGRIGLLFQDPESQLVTGRVRGEIEFPLRNLGWPPERIATRVEALLAEFELGRLADRSTDGLSGGEKTRVALAAALASEPEFLLLDEPGVYLDADSRTALRSRIRRRVEGGLGVLVVTQLEDEWRAAERRLRLEGGALRVAGAGEPVALEAPPGGERFPAPGGTPVVEARDLGFDYPSASPEGVSRSPGRLLEGVTLALHRGEAVYIEGESGAGKTTLLLLLAGVLEPGSGTVRATAGSVRPGADPGTRFGVLLQSPEDQLVAPTVLADVSLGLAGRGPGRAGAERRAARALAAVGLDAGAVAEIPPASLSHGQRRRAAWAGIWVLESSIWLLDEPTAGLDEAGIKILYDALARHLQSGGSALLVTQDPRLAWWAGRHLRLHRGRLSEVAVAPR